MACNKKEVKMDFADRLFKIIILTIMAAFVYLIFIALLTGLGWDDSIDSFANSRIIVKADTHILIDKEKNIAITDKTYAVSQSGNKIYAFSGRGYVVYNMDNGTECIFPNKNRKDFFTWDYNSPIVIPIESYSLFGEKEKVEFQKMFQNSREGRAWYYLYFYKSPYDSILRDVRNFQEITPVDNYKIINKNLYIYGNGLFSIYDYRKQDLRQYYDDSSASTYIDTKNKDILEKSRAYGEKYKVIKDFNEFTTDEMNILISLKAGKS